MSLRKVYRSQRITMIVIFALLGLNGCGEDSTEQTTQMGDVEAAENSTPEIPEIHLHSDHDSQSVDSREKVDLLALVNIEDCQISGNWTAVEQAIVSPKGNGFKLQIPFSPLRCMN